MMGSLNVRYRQYYRPGTILEKAFLLNKEFQKPEPRSLRMPRHLYDLERLMDNEFGKIALSDKELNCKVVEHRRKFYYRLCRLWQGLLRIYYVPPPERCLQMRSCQTRRSKLADGKQINNLYKRKSGKSSYGILKQIKWGACVLRITRYNLICFYGQGQSRCRCII